MLKLGCLYNGTLFSIYEYQMGACVSPVLMYPGDKSKDHFQAWDNALFSLDQI